MPHSGGRVGRGIYFASENAKSAAYGEPVNLFKNYAVLPYLSFFVNYRI